MAKKKQKPIYIILGTRAQIIKLAPLMFLLEKNGIEYQLFNTKQHIEKMEDLLEDFDIKTPMQDILNIKTEAKTIGLFGKWMIHMALITLNPFSRKKIFSQGRGLVLTHGDTVSTAWAALYARTSFCKVMHIEAGLRSHNLRRPFPEEIMRIITGWLSNYHICPDETAISNLKHYPGKKINAEANTMYDGVIFGLNAIKQDRSRIEKLKTELKLPEKFALVSIHRYENIFNKKMLQKVIDLLLIASKEIPLLFILHPSTEAQLIAEGYMEKLQSDKNFIFIERKNFIDFIALTEMSEFLLTDSGGNQQEMSYTGKPTLLIRDITEGSEGIGRNVIISNYSEKTVQNFIKKYKTYQYPKSTIKSPSEVALEAIIKIIK